MSSRAKGETIEADVAIIGAGPAGTAAAVRLGQLGVVDIVLVDRADFPRDKTCGSGISPKGIHALRTLGVWDDIEPECYWIRGLRLVTPGGRETALSGGADVEAVICQRRILDQVLLEHARSRGVRFVPDFAATELRSHDGRVTGFVARDGRQVSARCTMIAGGAHCRLAGDHRSRRLIQAIMGWWEGVTFRPHHVEMIFDRMLAPMYGWLFPESEERVNIGITYEDPEHRHNARELFQRFLDKHYGRRLEGARQVGGWKGHPIAYSYNIEKLTAPGYVVVGEAGLMTHPATGEGIYQGLRSGMLGAEAVRVVLETPRTEAETWARYERRCRSAFRYSFWAGALFRQLVRTPLLDWIAAAREQPLLQTVTARVMARM